MCKDTYTLSVILMNMMKTMMTNKLSTMPTIPMMLEMTLNTRFDRSLACSDGNVVTSLVTSLDNDEFSITATSSLGYLFQQQPVGYILAVQQSYRM